MTCPAWPRPRFPARGRILPPAPGSRRRCAAACAAGLRAGRPVRQASSVPTRTRPSTAQRGSTIALAWSLLLASTIASLPGVGRQRPEKSHADDVGGGVALPLPVLLLGHHLGSLLAGVHLTHHREAAGTRSEANDALGGVLAGEGCALAAEVGHAPDRRIGLAERDDILAERRVRRGDELLESVLQHRAHHQPALAIALVLVHRHL